MSALLEGAFADHPIDAAKAFRAVLDALARPGIRRRIASPQPPEALSPAAAGLLLTLADPDTPVWLAPAQRASGEWVVFHTGAPITADRTEAVFALGEWDDLTPLESWAMGTPDYPDRSVTLIVEMPELDGSTRLTLSGPGLEKARTISLPLPEQAPALLRANAERFPLGIDFFFTAGAEVIGLPRSTRIRAEEG